MGEENELYALSEGVKNSKVISVLVQPITSYPEHGIKPDLTFTDNLLRWLQAILTCPGMGGSRGGGRQGVRTPHWKIISGYRFP